MLDHDRRHHRFVEFMRDVPHERYPLLLVTLLAYLTLSPILSYRSGSVADHPVLTTAFAVVMLLSIRAIWRVRRVAIVASALIVLTFVTDPSFEIAGTSFLVRGVHHAVTFLLLGLLVVIILAHVLSRVRVSLDMILGACCAYLMMGMAWTHAYLLVELLLPNSFHFPSTTDFGTLDLQEQFTYFSFVTMTTLGYGDIQPVSPPARMLAAAQAVVGQLYIAILVARLVGVYVALRVNRLPSDD